VRFATDGHRETGITLHILQVHNRYRQPGGEDVATGAHRVRRRSQQGTGGCPAVRIGHGVRRNTVSRRAKQCRLSAHHSTAAGIGFGLASAVAEWRQGRSRRIETRVDAAAVLDVPLLGEIPKFSRSSSLSGGELVLGGEASEAYEFVLSSIEFALADIEASSILVTTAFSGDGKTVTALHVATASARGSRRVTLVDTPRIYLRGTAS
jgi:hypothetical protein